MADEAIGMIRALVPDARGLDFHGGQLLFERAAIFGYGQPGQISSGGSCRLIKTADGMIAINLARETDWELLPAWLEDDVPAMDWLALEARARGKATRNLLDRGRELGLPIAARPHDPNQRPADIRFMPFAEGVEQIFRRGTPPIGKSFQPRVVDLSSLWAGPLCGQLLQSCGAEVIKIESLHRPDGARSGPQDFFDLMNAGKQSIALDFSTVAGREALKKLIRSADIVIEASRPRALSQLGVDAEEMVGENACTWISITGYGRQAPQAEWIAFGDDAAVAAGLGLMCCDDDDAVEEAGFVGDAIADPLTGLHAALLAVMSHSNGGGQLIDVPLAGIARECLESMISQRALASSDGPSRPEMDEWRDCGPVRPSAGHAVRLGQHNEQILAAC